MKINENICQVDALCWYFWTDFFGLFYNHFESLGSGIRSTTISFINWINE